MEDGVNQKIGTNDDVREAFKDWDPRIDKMLSYVDEVLEWRVSFLLLGAHDTLVCTINPAGLTGDL